MGNVGLQSWAVKPESFAPLPSSIPEIRNLFWDDPWAPLTSLLLRWPPEVVYTESVSDGLSTRHVSL